MTKKYKIYHIVSNHQDEIAERDNIPKVKSSYLKKNKKK
jgi:hypothetical protein